jgi:hypothetical protein
LQYVKGKNRQETILATVNANHLPSLEGSLYVIGPFDDKTQWQGFNTAYPPEKEIDLTKKYPGKDGQQVAWKEIPALRIYTEQRLDFNSLLPNAGSACFYVYHRVESAAPTSWPVAIAQGHPSKVWLNGAPVSVLQGRYILDLKAGQNDLLAKVCNTSQASWQPGLSSTLEKAFGLRLELDDLPNEAGVKAVFEGEGLKVLGKSGDFAVAPQDMRDKKSSWWLGNGQLEAKTARQGEWTDLEVALAPARRRITVYLTKAPEHGIVRFSINGLPLGDQIDLYHPDKVNGAFELGTIPGSITYPAVLRVEVVGTNAKSTGIRYGWGLDCIVCRAER